MAFIRCGMNVFGSSVLILFCYTKIVIQNKLTVGTSALKLCIKVRIVYA